MSSPLLISLLVGYLGLTNLKVRPSTSLLFRSSVQKSRFAVYVNHRDATPRARLILDARALFVSSYLVAGTLWQGGE